MNDILTKIQMLWDARSERDRIYLLVAVVFFIFFLIYAVIFAPLWHAVASAQRNLQAAQNTLLWMKQVAPLAQKKSGFKQLKRDPLLAALATEFNRSPLQQAKHEWQQLGMKQIQLSCQHVPYTVLMAWLFEMNQAYVFSIKQMKLDKTSEPGIINALVLIEV